MTTHSQHEESTGFERRLQDVEHRLNESITTATERKEEVYGSLVQEIKEIKVVTKINVNSCTLSSRGTRTCSFYHWCYTSAILYT